MSAFDRITLPNGVRVITAPMAHVQSTACYVTIAAGSRYETTANDGAAHFVEHMLFCGTPRRPSVRALTGEVDAIGGLFNAMTSKEFTEYYVKVASEYAPQALDVLADMIRNSLYDPGEVEREKGVIIEEIRAKFDAPSDYVDENFELLVFGDTPMGRIRIGTEESVGAMTRDQLVEFAQEYYEPSRLVVGLAGRVDDELLPRVEELFGDLGGTRAPDAAPVPSANGGPRVLLDNKPIDQAQLCVGMRSYPLDHPDYYVVRLLSTILGGGMSSRLTEELTMQRGLAYSVFTVALSHTDVGTMYAQGGVNVDKVDEALAAIVTELRKVAEEPVGQDELDKARNYAKGRFVFSTETPQGLITYALSDQVLRGRLRDPAEVLEAMDAVTVDDLQRVAGDLLRGGLYLSMVGPFEDAERFERLLIA